MERITRTSLLLLTDILTNYTGCEYTVQNWNGYYHIYRDNGHKVTSGTARECHNYLHAYIDGLSYACHNMGAKAKTE